MDFFHTTVTDEAKDYVRQVLDSGFLSEGKWVERFEKALADQLHLTNPVTTNSGTSALHLALLAYGVKTGDEVILSPQTFIASALSVLYCGAVPVFCDINPKTGLMDVESVRSKITSKTVAIMPVHYCGYMCDRDAISDLATEHNLIVIEDAAHALGATYHDRPVGDSDSEAVVFSFQATKHLATGDGGCVCIRDNPHAAYAKRLRWFGISKQFDHENELGEREYTLNYEIGLKAHLNNIGAALGLGNLVGFEERLQKRRDNAREYETRLKDVDGIELIEYDKTSLPAYYAFPLLVQKDRLGLVRKLKERGATSSILHARIDRHRLLGGCNRDLVGQAEFEEKKLFVPVHEGLTSDEIELVIEAIESGW